MDNKITKRRLSDFLSYEWILMIATALGVIIIWELIFTMTSVGLTVGQDFKFYFDQTIDSGSSNKFYTLIDDKDNPGRTIFSYDVLKISHETLTEDYSLLSDRLSVQEGDIIITDCAKPEDNAKDKSVRAKTMVDKFNIYDFDALLKDAESYLLQFLKDGKDEETADVSDVNNLDELKIEKLFRERMKKDNRYRSEAQKLDGIRLEKERIYDLCNEVKKFRILLSQGDEYFFIYSRYAQSLQPDEVEQPKRYGLKVENLKGGTNASEYFKIGGTDTAKDVVVMVFDFLNYQPHLQFETISFINAIVDECSDLYNGI